MRFSFRRLLGFRGRGSERTSMPIALAIEADALASGSSIRMLDAARRIAEAIDRAISLRLHEHAERLAQAGVRLMHHSPRLTERIARFRLAQGRAEAALAIVDASPWKTASLRLLRAISLIDLGRVTCAHADLREWSRQATAPLEARRLLAMLELEHGNRDGAIAALIRNVRQADDLESIELLLLDSIAHARTEQAKEWAERLIEASKLSATAMETPILLETFGINTSHVKRAAPTPGQIESFALELAAEDSAERILQMLVRSQQVASDPFESQLLYLGAQTALPMLPNQANACESLARLAIVLERNDEALSWAMRGLELNPMSASLSRLVYELEDVRAESVEVERAGRPIASSRDSALRQHDRLVGSKAA
jgi:tetratricopeptide (TPR) repeat protein